ncbi:hypothetical protein SUDANB19_04161 [Streptomyces sp. enrichment culture]
MSTMPIPKGPMPRGTKRPEGPQGRRTGPADSGPTDSGAYVGAGCGCATWAGPGGRRETGEVRGSGGRVRPRAPAAWGDPGVRRAPGRIAWPMGLLT